MNPAEIAERLRDDMLAGRIRPGAELIQADLAERFGVSRIPVRDALGLLAAQDLVTVRPNRGARVAELSRSEIREIYHLRILLECDLVSAAAAAAGPDDIRRAERTRALSDLEAGGEAWAEGDRRFHAALYAPAQRPRQLAMIEALRRTCQMQISAYAGLPQQTPQWLADHAAMLDAWRDGDGDRAATCLRAHLERARDDLLARMPAG
jgi:DNA-binding GntR family transcriptional regulator